MKKLLLIFTCLLSQFSHAAGGIWKHHFISVEDITIRLSFSESRVAPTYGLHYGGRVAREINIDAWGDLEFKTLDYHLVNLSKGEAINEFQGTLIQDTRNHQYVRLNVRDVSSSLVDYIWLEGNEKNVQEFVLFIDERKYHIDLEL